MLVSDIPIEQCVGPKLVPAGSDPEIWPHLARNRQCEKTWRTSVDARRGADSTVEPKECTND